MLYVTTIVASLLTVFVYMTMVSSNAVATYVVVSVSTPYYS